MSRPTPVMLIILDGWGFRPACPDNAVAQAATPTFNALWAAGPRGYLRTCGPDVGLPVGQMGNSEVGHLNLGAGRVVMQDLPRIDAAIDDGSLPTLPALVDLIGRLRASGGTCHLIGLLSEGGVHSHQRHALALARVLVGAGVPVAVHGFSDGRDCAPDAMTRDLPAFLSGLPLGARLATLTGRYYAMDRDNRWERVSTAWRAIALAEGARVADPMQAVAENTAAGRSDEFVPAHVIGDYAGMADGDGVLCFNFRADRVREIMATLVDPAFSGFERPRVPKLAAAAGMTQYSVELDAHLATLFAPQPMTGLLGETVAAAGLTQLRMAETEKYPHVTYFLNGGEEAVLPGEERIMVPSPKVATYDLQPEMSAPELAAKAAAAIRAQKHALIVLNFANADMVGHTGSLPAAIKAVEAVDAGLGQIIAALRETGGAVLVTADHGNAETMRDPETGGPYTSHTLNVVPCVVFGGPEGTTLADGRLADVAPTLLGLLGIAQPAEMTGRSLLRHG
ncbi:phosphoglycerate mutase [Humitalea rosea]|uniref:2,3-bisphosphoglycerate-independent phosphoglycerate mutase n=1 Tax=Humitalea rosea TaxID=990373 RepID=A0A2W7HY02_9PROT|nr:2,3-bisphosphoglycerate-independent phosphoglycerate mutase [Humitalea rosea]PZW39354.1 phosphoglycerate mutase [Humitalea rosea]